MASSAATRSGFRLTFNFLGICARCESKCGPRCPLGSVQRPWENRAADGKVARTDVSCFDGFSQADVWVCISIILCKNKLLELLRFSHIAVAASREMHRATLALLDQSLSRSKSQSALQQLLNCGGNAVAPEVCRYISASIPENIIIRFSLVPKIYILTADTLTQDCCV